MMLHVGSLQKFLFLAILLIPAAMADDQQGAGKQVAVEVSGSYFLQAGDEISVHSIQAKEISDKTYRLDRNGEINFPMAGVVKLAGYTVRDAEKLIADGLKKYYRDPDVEINVTAFHSEPISVLGAVGAPGIYQIKGEMTLLDALSGAGGVRGDAGPTVILTRQNQYGTISHRDARQTLNGQSVVEIDLKTLMDARNSTENISIQPHDVISVPAAQLVYVVGNVKHAGGFALGGRPTLSVLQAIALAEGLDPRAAPSKVQILRRGSTAEDRIPVDVKKILDGKAEDIVLHPNDILFVPSSTMKVITSRTIDAAIQIGTGLAIFHP